MSKIPVLSAKDVLRKLKRAGFCFDRQAKGSHEIWYNPETKRRTTVPNHPGHSLPIGTIKAIVQQAGIEMDDFLNL